MESSVGSRGDSYDNAMAETINGLYKAELIHKRGPWRTIDEVEFATLEWVDWFNNRRLLGPIGDIPPVEFEAAYYRQKPSRPWWPDSNQSASGIPGALHCLDRASSIITLTNASLAYLHGEYAAEVAGKPVRVIPRCVDLDRFAPGAGRAAASTVHGCIGTVLSGWFRLDWLSAWIHHVADSDDSGCF
jgi:hypothetical protein